MGESKIITKPNGELFNPDLAQRAITFINILKHTKGEWHGKNFDLLPWQTQIISDVFGTVKPNGYRQYNTAYVEIPKKQGKSELAAADVLHLLLQFFSLYGSICFEELMTQRIESYR